MKKWTLVIAALSGLVGLWALIGYVKANGLLDVAAWAFIIMVLVCLGFATLGALKNG